MKTKLRLTFLGLMLSSLLVAQGRLLSSELRDLLHEALSGERAKDHVIQITRHNRIQASRGYRNAAQYVLRQLRRSGSAEKNAYVESFPSDGKMNATEIRNALSAQFRPIRQREVTRYLDDLVKVRVLEWK